MTGGMTTTPVLVPVSRHIASPMFVVGTRYQPNAPRTERIFEEGDVKDRGSLFAFDVSTGKENWHFLADSVASFLSEPTVFTIGDRTRYTRAIVTIPVPTSPKFRYSILTYLSTYPAQPSPHCHVPPALYLLSNVLCLASYTSLESSLSPRE